MRRSPTYFGVRSTNKTGEVEEVGKSDSSPKMEWFKGETTQTRAIQTRHVQWRR